MVLSLLETLWGASKAVFELEILAADRDRESKEPREPRGEAVLELVDAFFLLEAEFGSASVTICEKPASVYESRCLNVGVHTFTPMPSLLEAGMKRVVCPSLRLSDVRSG